PGGRARLAGVVGAPAGNGPVRPNAAGVEVTGVDAGRDGLGPGGGDRGPGIAGRRGGGLGGGRRGEDGEGREEEGGAPVGVDARERTRKVVDDHQLTSESVGWAEAKLVATERSRLGARPWERSESTPVVRFGASGRPSPPVCQGRMIAWVPAPPGGLRDARARVRRRHRGGAARFRSGPSPRGATCFLEARPCMTSESRSSASPCPCIFVCRVSPRQQ